MKFTKMSLVAAMLVGSSAFAVENVKVSGDANVLYATSDKQSTPSILAGNDSELFDKDSSAADIALNIAVSADLVKNDLVSVSGKVGYTVLTTLGLENNFVSNVWGGSHTATTGTGAGYAGSEHSAVLPGGLGGAKVEEANYFTEAFVAVSVANSALQLGRMELDTPLAFTEKWSAEKNTFEAAVLVNQDIPDTTVVAAFIGNGNGTEGFGQANLLSNVTTIPAGLGAPSLAIAPVVNGEGNFGTFGTDGAYALGVVNNSHKPLTVQAWYYDVTRFVQAYWLQADVDCQLVPGLKVGVQYSAHEIDEDVADVDSDIISAMLGYEMKDLFTAKVAYSQTGEDFAAGFNVATGTGNTKLYTKTFWNYGINKGVTAADTTAYKASVSSPVNGIVDLGLCYTFADQAEETGPNDMTEIALVAKKSFGPLDVKAAFVNTDEGKAVKDAYNSVYAYLTLNF